jgi:glycosyltransferase involved in cell wall biosynthesis
LARRGFALRWAATDLEGDAAADPSPVERVPMRGSNRLEQRIGVPYPLWGPRALFRLRQEVQRADLVHLHDSVYAGNLAAFALARVARRPVVVTQHVGAVPFLSPFARAALAGANRTVARALLGGADATVFVSDRVRGYFAERVRFRRPPELWPNGVDARFRPLPAGERAAARARLGAGDRPLVLFVGRFVEKKGIGRLRALAERFPDADWRFVGWGPADPSRWGLPQVRVLGRLDHAQLVPLYQSADLLVLPSVGEGFPLVVQEAMACGTPALIGEETAAGAPGIERVAWVAGLDQEPLSARLAEILADRAALAGRRAEVAAFARAWDWDDCAGRYAALFSELGALGAAAPVS